MRTSTPYLAVAVAVAVATKCKDDSELYCDEAAPCTDPARPTTSTIGDDATSFDEAPRTWG